MEINSTWNPLTLSDDRQVVEVEAGLTVNEIIAEAGLDFERPFYLLLNGRPMGRAEWDSYRVQETDVCHFVELPGAGVGATIAAWIGTHLAAYTAMQLSTAMLIGKTIASAAVYAATIGGLQLLNRFLAQAPDTKDASAIGQAEQPYSISTGHNQVRLKQPFAEQFGCLKIYPDLIEYPSVIYDHIIVDRERSRLRDNTKQRFRFFGIIGIGEYTIDRIAIGDLELPEGYDADLKSNVLIIGPGELPETVFPFDTFMQSPICFPNNLLAGTKLNSDPADEIVYSRAVLCPPGEKVRQVEWDLTAPQGQYSYTGAGYYGTSVWLRAYVREIDDTGDPVGAGTWTALFNGSDSGYTESLVLVDCNARHLAGTLRYSLPYYARWELKIACIDPAYPHTNYINDIYLGQIRGLGADYRTSMQYAGFRAAVADCTLIAVRLEAGGAINGEVADKLSVVCTRKLEQVTSTGFAATKTTSQSIADMVAHVVTSSNGGQQSDDIIDWSSLAALRATWETNQWHFNYRFQSRMSVMEACALAAKHGRAVPYLPGKFMLVMDEEKATPSMVFSVDDYTEGSFRMTHNLRTADDPTGVEVHCVDADTWSDTVVECYDANGDDTNMAVVDLPGCTSRQQAYEIGMYQWLDHLNNRTDIEFSCGLKGNVTLPGARVQIDVPAADGFVHSGLIQEIDGTDVYLSESIVWGSETTGVLYITGSAGGLAGPYSVTRQAAEYVVTGSLPAGTKTVATDAGEAARYLFAFSADDVVSMRVTGILPAGENDVRLVGTVYGALPFADPGTLASTSNLLSSISLIYEEYDAVGGTYDYTLSWDGSATEVRIEVDEGSGYAIEQDHYSDANYDLSVSVTVVSVKVTPYDSGVLSPDDAMEDAHAVPEPVDNLALDGSVADGAYTLTWDAVAGTDYYVMTFEADGEIIGWLAAYENTRAITAAETLGMAGDDDVAAEDWTVHVASVIDGDVGKRDSLAVNYTGWNPTGLTATAKSYSILLEITYTQTASFEALEIWMAESNDRSAAVKAGETGAAQYLVSGLDNDGTYYFWVRVRLAGGRYTSWYPSSDAAGVECEITFDPGRISSITAKGIEDGVTFEWPANPVTGTLVETPASMEYFKRYNYCYGVTWSAARKYGLGDQIVAVSEYGNQCLLTCTTAGTSGATEPVFHDFDTTSDGTVVWDTYLRFGWTATTAFTTDHYLLIYPDALGGITTLQCTTAGTTGATEPTWPTDTGDTVNDGSAVWTVIDSETYNRQYWAIEHTATNRVDIFLSDRQKQLQGFGADSMRIWVWVEDQFGNVDTTTTGVGTCLNQKTSITVGSDITLGTYDDIQEAISYFQGGRIFLKNGIYQLTSEIEIPASYPCEIVGESEDGVIIKNSPNSETKSASPAFLLDSNTKTVTISNLTIQSQNIITGYPYPESFMIYMTGNADFTAPVSIRCVTIENSETTLDTGIFKSGYQGQLDIQNVLIKNGHRGIRVANSYAGINIYNVRIIDAQYGVYAEIGYDYLCKISAVVTGFKYYGIYVKELLPVA